MNKKYIFRLLFLFVIFHSSVHRAAETEMSDGIKDIQKDHQNKQLKVFICCTCGVSYLVGTTMASCLISGFPSYLIIPSSIPLGLSTGRCIQNGLNKDKKILDLFRRKIDPEGNYYYLSVKEIIKIYGSPNTRVATQHPAQHHMQNMPPIDLPPHQMPVAPIRIQPEHLQTVTTTNTYFRIRPGFNAGSPTDSRTPITSVQSIPHQIIMR